MRNQGIGSWPARRARKTPDRIAVEHGERRITYRQLHDRVLRLAHGLRGLGVGRGDRVAYLGSNHPAFLETLFAAGTLGAVFVPLNTRLAAPELAGHLADSGTVTLVHGGEHTKVIDAIRAGQTSQQGQTVGQGQAVGQGQTSRDGLAVQHVIGPFEYERILAAGPCEPIDEPVESCDPCLIMYTSGTTGRAKGAVLSHGNVIWNSVNVLVDADLAGEEATLVVAPLFHTAGLNMTCLPTLLKGGRVVLEPAFDADRTLALIEERRITFMFAVPSMYDALAASARWPDTDLTSLRTLMCGGAPVPDTTIRTYLNRGLTFVQGYGLTETSPGALLLDRTQAVAKAGAAGVPHFFTDVRVVRPDLTDCEPGEKGEVVISGPNVMAGYWNRPEATARAFTGSWLHSGDVAVLDADGYVRIVDRIKDMIISGGENIYPAEVENALLDHPDVAGAAVIGVPDLRWGEVLRAVVVLRPGARPDPEALRRHLAERIARYKIPASFHIVDELPRNAVGKIMRKLLREAHGTGSADQT